MHHYLQDREDSAWIVNEVETKQEKDELEHNEVGQRQKEATSYHGSLLLKDLHSATR